MVVKEPPTSGNGHIQNMPTTVSATVIGRVASPPQREATSETFHFWADPKQLVEKTQIVTTTSTIAGQSVTFYAVVSEVYRQSRRTNIGEEFDAFDGDVNYEPEFRADGITFAEATIVRAEPPVLTPPNEWSEVRLGTADDALKAYGGDEIAHPLAVGLIKNGGDVLAGPGFIDLDYLLGQNGGHLNVNGAAGRGTKSSFLLFVVYQLLREARRRHAERPSAPDTLQVVPILFNIKGFDLFHIHRSNRHLHEEHLEDWRALGVLDPGPFAGVTYLAPQMKGGDVAISTGSDAEVKPYSWSLADTIEHGLFSFLFAEEDVNDSNFSALLLDVEQWLTKELHEKDGSLTRSPRTDQSQPSTFQELVDRARPVSGQSALNTAIPGHHPGTWGKFYRRLVKLVLEGDGVLRRDERAGKPLDVGLRYTSDPIAIDLNGLAGKPELQRFVVATVLRQLIEQRTGVKASPGLVYLIMLDELNRFAPRGSRDPITKLIEQVAAEMRSQGIILLGAQQQASKVSETVVENAGIRAIGRSGTLELEQSIWRGLSRSARRKAASLPLDEKLIMQDSFREPMHVRIPFPAWAMRRDEAGREGPTADHRARDEEVATH
jgi:uncharacterized protein